MWNRRKDDDYAPRPAQVPSTPVESAMEGIPLSTMSAKSLETDAARGAATIGKSVSLKGQIFSREDLIVDGEVDGSIELAEHRLTVGPNGKVNAGVKAREIIVLGTILGNVEAGDRIEIRKEARLVGDIKTARIVIEDGAYFKGSIDVIRPEPAKTAAPARAQSASAGASVATMPASVLPGNGGR
ncbi:MAG: polymer-forming cytoskeletal protein [Acidobacteria bacterium]|nr:polymer-forming cytoskeletal protein [Acidobacteriota bacterium]MBI3469897.1 polymer-forming cytoskeletal protein [Candidatus Solibacter usitatus]